jgi:hypothetical protein
MILTVNKCEQVARLCRATFFLCKIDWSDIDFPEGFLRKSK